MRTLRVCFWLFAMLTLSGLALILYSVPTDSRVFPGQPVSSVWTFGPLVRGLHFWFAQIALLAALAAAVRMIFVKTNRPRAWWAAGTLVLTSLLWFTGMLLPWDQLYLWLAPVIRPLTGLIIICWLHTLVLPALLFALLIVYIRRQRSTHHETHS